MMRIITGRARGVRLDTLEGERTRPTAERTKEAVFSTLQFRLRDTRVLDLFAGSGQLGLEAISRGAAEAVFCDRARDAVEVIRRNVQKTRFESCSRVLCGDYVTVLPTLAGTKFDIVFLDPPYAIGAVPIALTLLLRHGLLAKESVVVCETANAEDVFGGDDALARLFVIEKQTRYGAACVTFLVPAFDALEGSEIK